MAPGDADNGQLMSLYRRYLGEPSAVSDVYLGFALFFGGLTIGIIGLLLFLLSSGIGPTSTGYWQLRELAISAALLGMPAFVLSIVVLLPVDVRAVYVGAAGGVVCLIAIGVFVASYPQSWNVPGRDYSPIGVTVYAGGVAVLVASTGAALVAYHLDRRSGGTVRQSVDVTEPNAESEETVSTAQVEEDIASAVAASDLTWGGVEQAKTRRLELVTDSGPEFSRSGLTTAPAARESTDATEVESAVSELRKLRGWQPETATGSDVDEQTTALRRLKDEQEGEEDRDREGMGRLIARFWGKG